MHTPSQLIGMVASGRLTAAQAVKMVEDEATPPTVTPGGTATSTPAKDPSPAGSPSPSPAKAPSPTPTA